MTLVQESMAERNFPPRAQFGRLADVIRVGFDSAAGR
jgi:hypothetical protein